MAYTLFYRGALSLMRTGRERIRNTFNEERPPLFSREMRCKVNEAWTLQNMVYGSACRAVCSCGKNAMVRLAYVNCKRKHKYEQIKNS